ncbi:MAG: TetR family transcriptional regulator [Pseudonocardiaceae bacterium]|nr:TetR family transcriptional regulator [Pseudonocardiaceae bacterium]
MSQKNKPGRPPVLTDDAVLDAARDAVLAVGARHTTLAEVARRLGVSRPTVYRRWPDADSLLASLHTREWTGLVEAEVARACEHPSRRTLVGIVVGAVAGIRDHPLFRKFRDVDPELLLPYVFHRRGRSTDAILTTVEQLLRNGQAEGQVRDGDPALLARAVMLTGQSFVISAATMTDGCSLEALDEQLAIMLDRYLAPGDPS